LSQEKRKKEAEENGEALFNIQPVRIGFRGAARSAQRAARSRGGGGGGGGTGARGGLKKYHPPHHLKKKESVNLRTKKF